MMGQSNRKMRERGPIEDEAHDERSNWVCEGV